MSLSGSQSIVECSTINFYLPAASYSGIQALSSHNTCFHCVEISAPARTFPGHKAFLITDLPSVVSVGIKFVISKTRKVEYGARCI